MSTTLTSSTDEAYANIIADMKLYLTSKYGERVQSVPWDQCTHILRGDMVVLPDSLETETDKRIVTLIVQYFVSKCRFSSREATTCISAITRLVCNKMKQ